MTPTAINVRKGISFGEIVSLMRQRRNQDSVLIRAMIETRDRYNGDIVLPMGDVEGARDMSPPVPRLIADAIDGNAMRAASPAPTIVCPALNPTVSLSVKRAAIRRRMLYSKWHETQLLLKLYRSYRHLVGYGTCAWSVEPDSLTRSARVSIMDPLTTYPELRSPDDIREPKNVGFVYGRSVEWITSRYPESKGFFSTAAGRNWDTLWDVVEWIDEDTIVIGILGPRMPAYRVQDARPYGYTGWELKRWKNKAGCVPVVVPRRVTLDRVMGQMEAMVPSVDLHARLTALELVMAEQHVFPDMFMLGKENAVPKIVSGQWKAGTTGEVNLVTTAQAVEAMNQQISPFIPEAISNLEQSIRESGGASSMFGGSDFNGARTGRAISQMGAFSIDPRVEEIQRIQERAVTCVNEYMIETEKGYFPQVKHFRFTGLPGDDQVVEYTPAKDLDSTLNAVSYPIPGADISQMSVAVAQMVGSRLMSLSTGRAKHPFIDDPQLEEAKIAEEELEMALGAAAAQQLNGGQMPIADGARILELLRKGTKIEIAIATAQREAQERQATAAPAPGTGQVAAPETQPGLASPGMGAEQPAGTGPTTTPVPQPAPSLANFHAITRNLSSNPTLAGTGGPVST